MMTLEARVSEIWAVSSPLDYLLLLTDQAAPPCPVFWRIFWIILGGSLLAKYIFGPGLPFWAASCCSLAVESPLCYWLAVWLFRLLWSSLACFGAVATGRACGLWRLM